MRTILIAPAFLAAFSVSLLTVARITTPGWNSGPNGACYLSQASGPIALLPLDARYKQRFRPWSAEEEEHNESSR